ncbi:hypothetical protein [Corynebacterium sp. A21]|uniref:hypothetical protein n=1 Tax=Corynebacterium sp. A21 TaxID=3457318 RepID=UPI003FD53190
MTAEDSHPELFPEEDSPGDSAAVLPPFETLFDVPELSAEQLESMIAVATDPATPDPGAELIPVDSGDPGQDPFAGDAALDPWDSEVDFRDQLREETTDSADPFGDSALDAAADEPFPDTDPLAGF